MPPTRTKGHNVRIDSVLKKEFPEQELYVVKCPAQNRYSVHREELCIPINLPSRFLESAALSDAPTTSRYFGPLFENHPAVVRARALGLPENKIRPLAMYWDGVQYNKKQSFVALYIEDLKSTRKHLVFIVSPALKHVITHIDPRSVLASVPVSYDNVGCVLSLLP
jgi:hypothetical protein